MAAYPANYGAYDQPSAPYGYPPNQQPQPGFVTQPGYPAHPGYPQPGYPAQPGYPPGQPGYPAQPTVCQPGPGGYYPGQQPTQTIIVQEKRDDDCAKDCCICALCAALCCFCCSD